MNIVKLVEKYVKDKIEEYKINSDDKYDFWNEHIKYVYEESIELAKKYNADIEIVSLGALLHDIALICEVGDRTDHHINGEKISSEILDEFSYSNLKKEKVLKCVYNHRSSKNAQTIEELCVADADILAHFDNIPMLFNSAFNRNNIKLNEVRNWMKECFEKDYNDLSDRTKALFEEKYKTICEVVLGEIYWSKTRNNLLKFDKYEQMWYIIIALKRKSNLNTYTSESGIVWTDYKFEVKEHLGANYRKDIILVG